MASSHLNKNCLLRAYAKRVFLPLESLPHYVAHCTGALEFLPLAPPTHSSSAHTLYIGDVIFLVAVQRVATGTKCQQTVSKVNGQFW